MLDYPLPQNDKSIIEQTRFEILQALKFKGGLPVLTVTPTYEGSQGETVLVDDGSTIRQICSYLNGTWRCKKLEEPSLTIKMGVVTKAIADGNGTQTIAHGLGKTPVFGRFTVFHSGDFYVFSIGSSDGTNQVGVSMANSVVTSNTTYAIYIKNGAQADVNSGSVTFDGTNISIAWTFTWAVGTYTIMWEVQ